MIAWVVVGTAGGEDERANSKARDINSRWRTQAARRTGLELDWNWTGTGRKTEESRSLPPGSLEARLVIRINTGSAAHDSDMQQPFYCRPIPTLDVLDVPLYSSRQCRPPPRSRRTEHRASPGPRGPNPVMSTSLASLLSTLWPVPGDSPTNGRISPSGLLPQGSKSTRVFSGSIQTEVGCQPVNPAARHRHVSVRFLFFFFSTTIPRDTLSFRNDCLVGSGPD